ERQRLVRLAEPVEQLRQIVGRSSLEHAEAELVGERDRAPLVLGGALDLLALHPEPQAVVVRDAQVKEIATLLAGADDLREALLALVVARAAGEKRPEQEQRDQPGLVITGHLGLHGRSPQVAEGILDPILPDDRAPLREQRAGGKALVAGSLHQRARPVCALRRCLPFARPVEDGRLLEEEVGGGGVVAARLAERARRL